MSTATETPQYMTALAKANETKQRHIAVRSELSAGMLSLADALEDPRCAGRFPVGRLLRAQRRWGPLKTTRFLSRLSIFEGRRVDALTERQKRLIVEALNRA